MHKERTETPEFNPINNVLTTTITEERQRPYITTRLALDDRENAVWLEGLKVATGGIGGVLGGAVLVLDNLSEGYKTGSFLNEASAVGLLALVGLSLKYSADHFKEARIARKEAKNIQQNKK